MSTAQNNAKHTKPRVVYKFVSFEVTKSILKGRKLKFSPPASFNDPYDCDVNLLDFYFDGIITDKVKQEIESLKEIFKGQFDLSKKPKEFWEKIYKGGQMQKINATKISCFSLVNDQQLMWSHYADKHNGICLQFDNLLGKRFIELDDESDITEGEVGYDSEKRINYVAEDRQYSIYRLFFTKGEDWSYEKEYRLILLNKKEEYYEFEEKFIMAIYFGLNVTQSQKNEIVDLCFGNGFGHISFFESKKDERKILFAPFFKFEK